jgi:PepSY-associated TM region
MVRATASFKRALIFVHRWLGVALSVIFFLWFASGIIMMYWSYPTVTTSDRLQRAPVLDPTMIKVAAGAAYEALGRELPPAQVRLSSFDGRPVYRFRARGREGDRSGAAGQMVFADDGSVVATVDGAMIDRAAAAWAGQSIRPARKEEVTEVDQWTVGGLRNLRPLFKYSWPDGQQVYVNGKTAEVVQYTTTKSRFWAYLGAVPHWLYFTPLRKHRSQWFSFVVWSSLIGTITPVLGIIVILSMCSPRKRYRHAGMPTSIPYRGWKRWHAIVGLSFGIIATTWAFSGLLSMGPFPIVDKLTDLMVPPPPDAAGSGAATRGPAIAEALRGSASFRFASYSDKDPKAAIAEIAGFAIKELEYTSFAGEPVYLATNDQGDTRVIPVHGQAATGFDTDQVMRIARVAAGSSLAELRLIDEYDAYYLDRRGERPLPVVYARLNDPLATRYYIDPKTARVVGHYSTRDWVNRWLYHGLHSMDFPWLYKRRPLWDIVVIILLVGGMTICVTALVLTWRVLMRKIAPLVGAHLSQANEDLTIR